MRKFLYKVEWAVSIPFCPCHRFMFLSSRIKDEFLLCQIFFIIFISIFSSPKSFFFRFSTFQQKRYLYIFIFLLYLIYFYNIEIHVCDKKGICVTWFPVMILTRHKRLNNNMTLFSQYDYTDYNFHSPYIARTSYIYFHVVGIKGGRIFEIPLE